MQKHFKTPSGCRPSQFVGAWAMEQSAFDALYAQAEMILNGGQYEVVARESREMAAQDTAQGYDLDTDGVAHFSIQGPMTRYPSSMQSVMGGTATLQVQHALRQAARDPDVKGAILHINSPGGESSCMADLCHEVARFRQEKPIDSHIEGIGTSAAYRLAAETNHISIDPAGITGSVGTITHMRDTSKLMERMGVKDIYVATGDRKSAGAPGTQITDKQIEDRQALVNDIGQSFVDAVRSRRPQITDQNMTDVARAGCYAATTAKSIGLVDSIASTEQSIERFKTALTNPNPSGSSSPTLPVLNATGGAVPQQRRVMLTNEQLAEAKSLPGCGDITAENADGKLLAAAKSLQNDASTTASEVSTLKAQVADLQAKLPQSIPAPLLKMAQSSARIVLNSAVKAQAITPGVGDQLAATLLGTEDAPSAIGLTPNASGECLATSIFSALANNGAAPRVGEQPEGQPAPKATPGAPASEGAISEDRIKALMETTPLGRSAMAK